jgi:coenzyme PQQ precursor peptide PqqA
LTFHPPSHENPHEAHQCARLDQRKGFGMQPPAQRVDHDGAAAGTGGGPAHPAPVTAAREGRLPWVKPRAEIVETGMEVTAYVAAD